MIQEEIAIKKKSIKRTTISIAAVVIAVVVGLCSDLAENYIAPPTITDFAIGELNSKFAIDINMNVEDHSGLGIRYLVSKADEEVVCDLETCDWDEYTENTEFSVPETGDYIIRFMDGIGNFSDTGVFHVDVDAVTAVILDKQAIYMPLEDTAALSASIEVVGNPDETLTWTVSDEKVAKLKPDGTVEAGNPGTAVITVSSTTGAYAECSVTVTDLYTKTMLQGSKTVIPAYRYTEEEAHLLDNCLFYEVEEAGGYGTRAGVIAAMRFLTLQFPYKIPYFFENGRLLNQDTRPSCDGEGRYYHRGLYLSTDKYADIVKSVSGPAIWGVDLTNYEDKYYFVRFQRYPNGLDCSGFVTWSIYNGGFDIGDTGAGDFAYWDYDLCDYGDQRRLTVDLLKSGEVKAGDLIGMDGHIALVAGIDYEHGYIHVAESLAAGVKISSYTFPRCVTCGIYDFVCLMDEVYGEQGNYTDMWEDAGEYFYKYYN